MATRWETKRPNEVRDYTIEWSEWLAGDSIAAITITVNGATLDRSTYDPDTVTAWISGGTDGTTATVTNTITTTAGRTETETFSILIRNVAEPVGLATVKAHLRVTDNSEDALILGLITAAREWVEGYTGHILVRRTVTQSFNGFANYFELWYRPVINVLSITYTDVNGAAQTLDGFDQTIGRYPFRVYPGAQPAVKDYSSVVVTFTAGYAEGEEPQSLIQAMLLLIGHWFANREVSVVGLVPAELPMSVKALCDQYRTHSI